MIQHGMAMCHINCCHTCVYKVFYVAVTSLFLTTTAALVFFLTEQLYVKTLDKGYKDWGGKMKDGAQLSRSVFQTSIV